MDLARCCQCMLILVTLTLFTSVESWFFNTVEDSLEYAPIVQLNHGGGVLGKIIEADEPGQVYVYEGFPYGTAKRFQKPVMHSGWKGTWNATFPRDSCPFAGLNEKTKHYTTDTYSDDCHYMTVWKPTFPSKVLRPVMVYIYGGAFLTGSVFKTNHDGRYIAARGDVIVVGFNYRLNQFGFLYAGDAAPGNMGLWDQTLALQWIKENIENFGGDPNSVTVFGNSAGSQSITLHMHSPVQSQKLFHRAILQSGASLILLHKDEAFNRTQRLAALLECPTEHAQEMVHCLQQRPIEDIIQVAKNNHIKFSPIVGDDFFPVSFADSINQTYFNHDIDIMFGVTANEGSGFIPMILPVLYPQEINFTLSEMIDDVPKVLEQFNLDTPELVQEVIEYYTRDVTDNTSPNELRDKLSTLRGDIELDCPVVLVVERFAKYAPQKKYHMYQLAQRAQRVTSACDQEWMGVCHTDELFYLFMIPEQMHEADRKVSQVMIRAWTLFARTGSPGYAAETFWEEAFDRESPNGPFVSDLRVKYMKLQHLNYTMIPAGEYERCEQFWIDRIAF